MGIFATDGQGFKQFLELGSAFLLSAAKGLEREVRHKSAGLRTYTLVGTTAALFLLVSKYGFMDVLAKELVVLDPSRVAAQIVTGIGFIGGEQGARTSTAGLNPSRRFARSASS
jgi:putative Mg2+ transporter-C (MgtC) family protein